MCIIYDHVTMCIKVLQKRKKEGRGNRVVPGYKAPSTVCRKADLRKYKHKYRYKIQHKYKYKYRYKYKIH